VADVASDDALRTASDDANDGGLIAPEDDDQSNLAEGGNSSSEGPDESLRNLWRFETADGGGIETAVETVGFEGASPVGVLARGIA
jgi:hypothetical protein